jgi:hypothetical protein
MYFHSNPCEAILVGVQLTHASAKDFCGDWVYPEPHGEYRFALRLKEIKWNYSVS